MAIVDDILYRNEKGSALTFAELDDNFYKLAYAIDNIQVANNSTVVVRDSSGNFTANTITANVVGNSTTTSQFLNARTINGVSFNGSNNITLTANTTQTLTRGSYLTGSNFNGGTATTWAVDATDASTASKVVVRDAFKNFAANTITANLIGNASTATNASSADTAVTLTGLTATITELNYADGVTSSIQTQLNSKSPLSSPTFTGTPAAPTAAVGTNTTQIATTAFVNAEIANDAPSKTGSGASGTWNISISGNAATATSATNVDTLSGLTATVTELNYTDGVTSSIQTQLNSKAPATDTFTKGADIGGSVDLNTYTTVGFYHQNSNANASSGTNYPAAAAGMLEVLADGVMVYQRYTIYNSGQIYSRSYYNGTWYAWRLNLDSSNYNSYAPTLTGTGASGTWAISISGNAATATTATTATTANALNTANDYRVDSLGVGTAASGVSGEIRATNNITAYYSDDRLKNKLGYIENALDKVMTLSGFYYEANETAQALGYEVKREVGVSAQEVQRVMPEIVAPAPIDEKYLTVRYERLVPLLIEAIIELKKELDEVKSGKTYYD